MILEKQNGKLVYSDGIGTEEMMLAIAKQYPEGASADYIAGDGRYTINNTFSPVRRNLLNWYPFKADADILEVGAGMGAVTGLLCDVGGSVTSVEMNELRANVIRARYPDRTNLSVISADVTNWHTQRRFDYVVVVGVLEYAGVFSSGSGGGDEPYIAFLSALRRLLKPDGVLLLAIENRFGLKYWLGGSEDHLQKPFVGIEGYKDKGTPKTFSKAELKSLFNDAGFNAQRYYYVLPDYKFPTAIFTDDALPTNHELLNINFTYSKGSTLVANERELYRAIIDNDMFPNFSNSYLVEAGVDCISESQVIRVSARGECKPEYRIITSIDRHQNVVKKAVDLRARVHIKDTYENGLELQKRGLNIVSAYLGDNDILHTNYQDHPLGSIVFCDALSDGNWNMVRTIIDKIREALVASSEETTEISPLLTQISELPQMDFGTILKDGYMDLTLGNSFWIDGQLHFFDQEWNFPNLPYRFLLYYGLKIAFIRSPKKSAIPFVEILRYIKVSEEEAVLWDRLEEAVWSQVLSRTGDIYGEDGYCNTYSDQMTLCFKQEERDRLLREQREESERLLREQREEKDRLLREQREEKDRLLREQREESERLLREQWEEKDRLLREQREESDRLLNEKEGVLEEKLNQIAILSKKCGESDIAIDQAAERLMGLEVHTRNLNNEWLKHEELSANLQNQLGDARARLNSANEQLAQMTGAENRLNQILASRTWRYGQKLISFFRLFFPVGSLRSRALGNILRSPLTLIRSLRQPGLIELPQADMHDNSNLLEGYPLLAVPKYNEPLVSIVIPVYNEFDYTYKCIQSILAVCEDTPFEIIIADDNSDDATKDIEKVIGGLTVIRNSENKRFLLNCNNAAEHACGKYIAFLNNDTLVHLNWMQSLVETLENDSTIGLVGSKLIYPDGRLQEAGGVIWNNASAWNFGRYQNPNDSAYNYVKEADYLSGCSLMIRKSLWREIGGFDERYVPAYYEDTDLAFEVRNHGYRVVYQPLSVVTHFEGVSNGTDVTSGQKSYQIKNQATFMHKWGAELKANHYENGTHVHRARDRSKNKKTLLMVDHYVPTFDKDAGSRFMDDMIRLFVNNGYQITFLPDNFNQSEYTERYQQMGVEVLYGSYLQKYWKQWILDNADEFDVVFLSRPHIAIHYMEFLREHTKAKILYYGHDLHCMRMQREYELTGEKDMLFSISKLRHDEFWLMKRVDCAFFPSFEEERVINQMDPSVRVMTLPGFLYDEVEDAPYRIENRKNIIFVGGFAHLPNVDAVLWFTKEIFPGILEKEPNMIFHIVGSNAPAEIKALEGPRIKVHGFVSNEKLFKLYAQSRLSVVPLRYGAGVKGKIVECMAKGVPVVTTSIGAEGLENAKSYLAVEDTADGFASAVCSLYNDEKILSEMCEKAYRAIEDQFSPKRAMEIISCALDED